MPIFDATATCFYHPIKIIFVDDNRAFLDVLELEFDSHWTMQMFTSPHEALATLNKSNEMVNNATFKLINDVDADTTLDPVISFATNKLLNIIYDRSRFDQVPVLVVDYEMPDMNGVEFWHGSKSTVFSEHFTF